jgi:hypothetical protein
MIMMYEGSLKGFDHWFGQPFCFRIQPLKTERVNNFYFLISDIPQHLTLVGDFSPFVDFGVTIHRPLYIVLKSCFPSENFVVGNKLG